MDARTKLIMDIRRMTSTDVPISKVPVPDAVRTYAEVENYDGDVEAEIVAYRDFCDRFASEKDFKTRIVLQQVLNATLHDGAMPMSYALSTKLDDLLKDELRAKKAIYPDELYNVVGNPIGNALNWKDMNVRPFVPDGRKPGLLKNLRHHYAEWTALEIQYSYIEIGKHNFSFGKAVTGVLDALEARYGLDFTKLEGDYQRKKKKAPKGL